MRLALRWSALFNTLAAPLPGWSGPAAALLGTASRWSGWLAKLLHVACVLQALCR